jgi:subtilisin family serine protease
MQWPGHITVTLHSGEGLAHIPSQLDVIAGAGRAVSRMDDGAIDRVLRRWGGGARAATVFSSRHGLGRAGEHHLNFDDTEEQLGMSRTYRVHIADPARTREVCDALRDLSKVQSAAIQTLATAPMAAIASPHEVGDAAITRDPALPYRRIHVPEAHALEMADEDVTVGVVDTGVALGHTELQRKCLAGYNTVDMGIGQLSGQMRLVGDSWGVGFNPIDEVGHGSFCAGILGAQGWHLPRGVAGKALILPIRVLAAAQMHPGGPRIGVGAVADIDAGMKVCVDLGADVINMSFGTAESSLTAGDPLPHQQVVQYAVGYGCTLVAAAGNKGDDERYYPAALPEVIAVGSVSDDGRRSHFSSYGDHLSVCAPGEDIVGLSRHGYRMGSGTSFAAPFVCGVASLLVSRARKRGVSLNGERVKQIIADSAMPLSREPFSPKTGYGLVDALSAIRRLDAELTQQEGHQGGHA